MTPEPQRYSHDAAKRILNQALDFQAEEQDGAFSRDQLAEMASDLGISNDALQHAEAQWLREQQGVATSEPQQADMQLFMQERRRFYGMHLATFATITLLLFMGGFIAFSYPMLVWALGLVLHTVLVMQTQGFVFDSEYEVWRANRKLFRHVSPNRSLPS